MLALLAEESAEKGSEIPWGVTGWGLGALALLLVALYVVTRFDPDR